MSTPQPQPHPTTTLLPNPLILHPPTLMPHSPLLPFTPFTPCTPLPQLPKTSTTPSQLPVDFLEILENWRIPNFDTWAVLPDVLVKAWGAVAPSEGTATPQGKKRTDDTKDGDESQGDEYEKKATGRNKGKIQNYPWTPALLFSLLTLSKLTVGNRTRAHNLLITYYAARVRESSGRNHTNAGAAGEIAQLAVCDVEQAILSVRRMSRGREMEGCSVLGKRKYSIKDEAEVGVGMQRARECSRVLGMVVEVEEGLLGGREGGEGERCGQGEQENGTGGDLSPPEKRSKQSSLPLPLPLPPSSSSPAPPFPPTLTPKTTKRLIHLPPIQTHNITTPTSLALLSLDPTPPQDHNPDNTHEPASSVPQPLPPSLLSTSPYFPPGPLSPLPLLPSSPTTLSPTSFSPILALQTRALENLHHTTHAFNLRRLELQYAARMYEGARVRALEAEERMNRARGRVKGGAGGSGDTTGW